MGVKERILILQGGFGEQDEGNAAAFGRGQGGDVAVGADRQDHIRLEVIQQPAFFPHQGQVSMHEAGNVPEPAQPADLLETQVLPGRLACRLGSAKLQVYPVAEPGQGRGKVPDLGGRADGRPVDIIMVIEV